MDFPSGGKRDAFFINRPACSDTCPPVPYICDMRHAGPSIPETLLFEASISPNRSLSHRGKIWLLVALTAGCALMAARAIALGAWPVAVFGVLELGLATLLFWIHSKSQRRTELLLLSRDSFRLIHTGADGTRQHTTLPLRWLAIEIEERAGRVPGLYVRCRGDRMELRRHEIARALGDSEKRDLAVCLQEAVCKLQRPDFDNWQLRRIEEPQSEQDSNR